MGIKFGGHDSQITYEDIRVVYFASRCSCCQFHNVKENKNQEGKHLSSCSIGFYSNLEYGTYRTSKPTICRIYNYYSDRPRSMPYANSFIYDKTISA